MSQSKILKSLEVVTTGYTVFERDQVLTFEQLNGVADYFNDQTRLTRVKLLGVGIGCGLRASVQAGEITVTKGAGVTTDGDLLFFDRDTVFDTFKDYDDSNPAYDPFKKDETGGRIYELLPQGTADPRATPLGQFAATTGLSVGDMVAVLFMESVVKDSDLCSGTDCDNLGKDFVNNTKLLLVKKSLAELLGGAARTPADAFNKLAELVMERPRFSSSIITPRELATIYRNCCAGIHNKLLAELAKIYPNCSGFLGALFDSDPIGRWTVKLNGFKNDFAADSGIQYYYDFLKDVGETYNVFRDLLFDENTWCCPDPDGFPKHLLLGDLSPGTGPRGNRTGFYPSPITSRTTKVLERARFLAGKIDILIETFAVPVASTQIRITPSMTEDRCLEERAIPYYYSVTTEKPIQKAWNFALTQRGMDACNYSYNAAEYGARGRAAQPLESQIACFNFFRVEGHLGQNVSAVVSRLESEIRSKNLPVTVRSVLADADRTRIVKKPGTRYGDLHRFHYLLRQDVAKQLDDVTQFSGNFKKQVETAVSANVVSNSTADNDGVDVLTIAADKHAQVLQNSRRTQEKLSLNYSTFRADDSWRKSLGDTMQAAGDFKAGLGKVAKTEFNTPFDSLIGSSHIHWIDWLGEIIKDKDDKSDGRLLFSKFVDEHAGIDHRGGVPRGGTFVLVYDSDSKVIADFALDYRCEDEPVEQPDEPELKMPDWKPGSLLEKGITISSSRERFLATNLESFTKAVVEPRVNTQRDYINIFKDVAGMFGNVKSGPIEAGVGKFSDEILGALANESAAKQKLINLYKEKAIDPGQPTEMRDAFRKQAADLEPDLGNSLQKVAEYLAVSGKDVTAGSEGHTALTEIAKSYDLIRDSGTRDTIKAGLSGLRDRSGNAGFKSAIGGILMR